MPISIYLTLLIEMIFVSYVDLKKKKISNNWIFVNCILYIAALIFFPKIYNFSWEVLVFPLSFLFVGYILFLLKIMGAGDSKYLAMLFLLIPLRLQEEYFLTLTYITIWVGLILLSRNSIKNFEKLVVAYKLKDIRIVKGVYGKKFSFAPVIMVTWIWFGLKNLVTV